MDEIHGVTLQVMAETMSKHGELKAQWGETGYRAHFQQYLATKGLDEHRWSQAWNAWHVRMDADKTGQQWARYHEIESALSMKAHMGDVADMSQDVKGGLTLDMYARLSAEIAQPGVDYQAVLAKHGVAAGTWNTGRDAWNDAMSKDTLHKVSTQYGMLYAKYNPAHQAAMTAHMGQMIANRDDSSTRADEPEEEYTAEKALHELRDPTPKVRWAAAHHVAQKVQTELSGDPARRQHAHDACVPVLIECLERHDKATVSNAETAARDLVELGHFSDDAKTAIEHCLGRGREHLATVEAAFAPVQHKNVPERVYLQSEMQDYQGLVETLQDIVNDWDEKAAEAKEQSYAHVTHSGEMRVGGSAADSHSSATGTDGVGGLFQKILSFFR